jgi:hypothetical protein
VIFLPVLANCLGEASGSGPSVGTPESHLAEFGGQLSVYERIVAVTDCATLQDEIDLARANNESAERGTDEFRSNLGYMVAADARMHVLGCFSSIPP